MNEAVDVTARVDEAFDAYVFDLDGTVYLGDTLLAGVRTLLAALDRARRPRAFITNNPTRSPESYAAKLARLGLRVEPSDIITSATITAAWIRKHVPDATCLVLGEDVLIRTLEGAGIRTSMDPDAVDLVIASYDRTFTYAKLRAAFDALWRRPETTFIATHPDAYCPLGPSSGEPDAGAIIAAVEASTERICEVVLGKPSPDALRTAASMLGVAPERTIVVGDRLATDIAMGRASGAATALVLTGDSGIGDVAALRPVARPDYVLERIDALAAAIDQG